MRLKPFSDWILGALKALWPECDPSSNHNINGKRWEIPYYETNTPAVGLSLESSLSSLTRQPIQRIGQFAPMFWAQIPEHKILADTADLD